MSMVPFGALPPEIQEAIKTQMDHQRMHAQVDAHNIKSLLDSLDAEQLSTLDSLLHEVAGGAIDFYCGKISMILQLKFDKCPCNESHDADVEFAADLPEEPRPLTEDLMRRYGLTSDGDALFCANCNMEYASLDDRMLRPEGPEGCTGCVQKSKWG